MFEEVILVANKCDFEKRSWKVDTHIGEEVNTFHFSLPKLRFLLYNIIIIVNVEMDS